MIAALEFEDLVATSVAAEGVLEYKDRGERDSTFMMMLASVVLPLLLLLFLYLMFRRTRDQFLGGGFLSGFSKSTARRFEGSKQPITFADVAGLDSVKADLQEMVDFLKDYCGVSEVDEFITKKEDEHFALPKIRP